MPAPPHIVVEVSGGVVNAVWSNDPNTTVTIYDWDNIHDADDDSPDTREAEYADEIDKMHEVS